MCPMETSMLRLRNIEKSAKASSITKSSAAVLTSKIKASKSGNSKLKRATNLSGLLNKIHCCQKAVKLRN